MVNMIKKEKEKFEKTISNKNITYVKKEVIKDTFIKILISII